MKRLLCLLLALPLLSVMTSCDDDDNIPQVDLTVDYSGATLEDGALYVVQGETLEITGLHAIPAEGTKAATISSASYYWDGIPVWRINFSPFPVSINTADMRTGRHTLGIYANVLQVGKSIGFAVTEIPVVIVENEQQQPGEGDGGTVAPDTHMSKTEQ